MMLRSFVAAFALLPLFVSAHPGHSAFNVTSAAPHPGHAGEWLSLLLLGVAALWPLVRRFGFGGR